jgi:hypothetical protein
VLILLLYQSHIAFLIQDTFTATKDVYLYEEGYNDLITYIYSEFNSSQTFVAVYEWRALFLRAFDYSVITEYPPKADELWVFATETDSFLIIPKGLHKIKGDLFDIATYYSTSGFFDMIYENEGVLLLSPSGVS